MATTGNPYPRMNVTDPLGQAISRSKFLLFEQGSFPTWLRFGVIAFLSSFGSGGGSGGGPGGGGSSGNGGPAIDQLVRDGQEFVREHFVIIAILGTMFLLCIMGLSLLLAWLKSRGQAMLIHAVATGNPTISPAWNYTSRQGNSAFFFRAILWLIGSFVTLATLVFAGLIVVGLAGNHESNLLPYFAALIPVIVVFLLVALVFWVLEMLLGVFVLPLMYRFDTGVMDGWRQFRILSTGNIGPLILVILIRIAYSVAFTFVAMLVGCFTCCIGFLPIIHHTLFAPYYVFDRAYTLYAIGSLGPDYAMVQEPDLPPPLPEG